jgi:allophanate hydrolase subunit 2
VSPLEKARITAAAIKNGRRQRREQGIPESVNCDEFAARIAALLRGDRA